MWWESDPCYRWESWVTTMNMNSKICQNIWQRFGKKSRTGILVKHLLEGRRFFRSHMKSSCFNLQFLHSLPFQKAGAGTFATWFAGAPVPWAQIVFFFVGGLDSLNFVSLGGSKKQKHQMNMEKLFYIKSDGVETTVGCLLYLGMKWIDETNHVLIW